MIHVSHAVIISSNQDRRQGRQAARLDRRNGIDSRGRQADSGTETETGGQQANKPYIPGNGIHRRPPTTPDCLIYTCKHQYPLLPLSLSPYPFPTSGLLLPYLPSQWFLYGIPLPPNPLYSSLGYFRLGILPYGMEYPFNCVLRAI